VLSPAPAPSSSQPTLEKPEPELEFESDPRYTVHDDVHQNSSSTSVHTWSRSLTHEEDADTSAGDTDMEVAELEEPFKSKSEFESED
jgi:hypothetical protein